MTTNQPDRLDRVEALLADFIAASTADRQQSNRELAETRQLTSSNAKAIQALTDDLVTFKLTTEQANQEIKGAVLKLTEVTEGIAHLVSSLDSDRPTILRKLNSVENKLDRLLERSEGRGNGEE